MLRMQKTGQQMSKIAKKIKDLRIQMNLKQRELGEKLGGVLQSTVSQWERGKQEPDAENSLKLAAIAGVEPHEWMDMPKLGESTIRQRRVPLVGVLQAGDWREAVEYPESDQRLIEAPIPAMIEDRYPTNRLELQAFEVAGSSMNKVYPEGTTVYAASTMSFREPENLDRVIVVRKDKHGLYEATLKELVIEDDGRKWLYPRSHDPEHQAPIQYVRGGGDDEVTISGIVIASLVLEASRKQRK